MAAMIATERRLRMRMPGRDLVVQNVVNWRTVRGYGRQWRGRSEWIGRPGREAGGGRESRLKKRGKKGYPKQSNPTLFLKKVRGPKKNRLMNFYLRGSLGAPH